MTLLVQLLGIVAMLNGCNRSADLWNAIDRDDVLAIRKFAESGGNLNKSDFRVTQFPLLYALRHEKNDSYRALLELGADPNAITSDNRSVMFEAAAHIDGHWLEEALAHGGNPNLVKERSAEMSWRTPLECAITCGNLRNVEILVKNGADIEINDPIDGTPLAIAAKRRHFDIVYYLLELGANYQSPTQEQSEFLFYVRTGINSVGLDAVQSRWLAKVNEWLRARNIDVLALRFEFSK